MIVTWTRRQTFQSTLPRGERRRTEALCGRNKDISIHAPARGATPHFMIFFISSSNFNPRSREGSDDLAAFFSCAVVISIHAPARGATRSGDILLTLRVDFNPRSREGSDPAQGQQSIGNWHFNPRSREGSDCTFNQKSSANLLMLPRFLGVLSPKRLLKAFFLP